MLADGQLVLHENDDIHLVLVVTSADSIHDCCGLDLLHLWFQGEVLADRLGGELDEEPECGPSLRCHVALDRVKISRGAGGGSAYAGSPPGPPRAPQGMLCGVGVLLVMSACSGADEASSPYNADISQAREAATSEFERTVLDDGEISDAEFDEARGLLAECIVARGYLFQVEEGGGYSVGSDDPRPTDPDAAAAYDEAIDDAHTECGVGSTDVIEPLYLAMNENPSNVDLNEVWASCLVDQGFRDAGYGVEDLVEEMDAEAIAEAEAEACFSNGPGGNG